MNWPTTRSSPLALPSGVSLASLTFVTTGVGKNLDGQLQDFVAIDPDKFREAVGLDSYTYCSIECAKGTYGGVDEKYGSGYLMFKFDTRDVLPFNLRGDAGCVTSIPASTPMDRSPPRRRRRSDE